MGYMDYASGQWIEDDGNFTPPNPGMVGEQAGAPVDQPPLAPIAEMPPPVGPQPTPPPPPLPQPAPPPAPPPPVAAPPPVVPQFVPPPPPAVPMPPPPPRQPGTVGSREVMSPEERQNLGNMDLTNLRRRENATEAGAQDVRRATLDAGQADAAQALRARQAQEAADLQAAQQKVVIQRQAQDAEEYAKYKGMGLKDPDAEQSTLHKFGAALAIGLGQYAASMTHTENMAAKIFADARAHNLEIQRAAIEKQKEAAIKSGQDVTQAKQDAADALHSLQVKQLAQTEAFKDEFIAKSKGLGIPDARIAATKTVLDLDKQALDEREKILQSGRERIRDLTPHEMAAAHVKATGGGRGGAGAGGDGGASKIAQYLTDNPGDVAGARRLAEKSGVKEKVLATVINEMKGTGENVKDARQASIGLRAIDQIEQSGYTPSRDDIQQWLNNQRSVSIANKMGETGFGAVAAGLGQKAGLLKQSETEGLSPDAAAYFSNVRRFMETIGRAQSGAAISNTEWTNFFNQYGPNSKGGMDAARQYLHDQLRSSGVSGRQMESGGSVPAARVPATGPATVDRKALAREAINDPNAPPAVKARALQILREEQARGQ